MISETARKKIIEPATLYADKNITKPLTSLKNLNKDIKIWMFTILLANGVSLLCYNYRCVEFSVNPLKLWLQWEDVLTPTESNEHTFVHLEGSKLNHFYR